DPAGELVVQAIPIDAMKIGVEVVLFDGAPDLFEDLLAFLIRHQCWRWLSGWRERRRGGRWRERRRGGRRRRSWCGALGRARGRCWLHGWLGNQLRRSGVNLGGM